MEDYEIRDTLRRATTPVLQVTLNLAGKRTAQLEFIPNQNVSKPLTLNALVTNQSPQPAYHSVIYLGIDSEITTLVNVGFDRAGPPAGHAHEQKIWFVKRYTSPPDQPIFQEATPNPLGLNFTVSSQHVLNHYFHITTIVQTPGFAATDYWAINCTSGMLKLYGPNDPNWMPTNKTHDIQKS